MAQKRKAIHYCLNEYHPQKLVVASIIANGGVIDFLFWASLTMFINLKFEPLDKWSKSSDSIRFVLFWTNSSWKFKEYSNRPVLFVFETFYTSIQITFSLSFKFLYSFLDLKFIVLNLKLFDVIRLRTLTLS